MRLRARSHPLVGVDLGATEIRAARIQTPTFGKDAKVVVTGVAARPSDGAVTEGRVVSVGNLAGPLSQTLEDLNVRGNTPVAVAVSGRNVGVALRRISSGFEPSEWRPAVRVHGGQLTTALSAADADLSIVPLGVDAGHVVLSIVGADKTHAATITRLFTQVPGTLHHIEPAAASLLRAYTHTHPDDTTESVLVSIGHSHTLVVGRRGPHLVSLTTLNDGVATITSRLKVDAGIGQDDAERLVRRLVATDRSVIPTTVAAAELEGGLDTFDGLTAPAQTRTTADAQTTYGDIFTDAVDDLVNQIASAVETTVETDGELLTDPAGVVLTGRGALLRGIARRVESRLALPCYGGLPWASVRVSDQTRPMLAAEPSNPDSLYVPSDTWHRFGVAIGAAMSTL